MGIRTWGSLSTVRAPPNEPNDAVGTIRYFYPTAPRLQFHPVGALNTVYERTRMDNAILRIGPNSRMEAVSYTREASASPRHGLFQGPSARPYITMLSIWGRVANSPRDQFYVMHQDALCEARRVTNSLHGASYQFSPGSVLVMIQDPIREASYHFSSYGAELPILPVISLRRNQDAVLRLFRTRGIVCV
jgi:hypothetical protein